MEVQNGLERVELEKECYNLILDGEKTKNVIAYLIGNGISKRVSLNIYYNVLEDINTIRDRKLPAIITMHIGRYEELYARCVSWGMELQAMSVLHAKESLLRMIKDEDRERIYNFKEADNLVLTDTEYNFNLLDDQKNARFHELLAKIGMTDGYKQIGN